MVPSQAGSLTQTPLEERATEVLEVSREISPTPPLPTLTPAFQFAPGCSQGDQALAERTLLGSCLH